MSSPSRIDPLSWTIFVAHPEPRVKRDELWGNPSNYPAMQHVIHESIHFWHSISTLQGIRLAFDCLKSLNALRFAARQGVELSQIGPGWRFDGYEPFAVLREFFETPSSRKSLADAFPAKESLPELSAFNLFEGLARYWDVTISSGLTTSGMVDGLIAESSESYSSAYRYADEQVGGVAFIVFPLFAYLALCTDSPVESFASSLRSFRERGFPVPRGDFQVAWNHAWVACSRWDALYPRPYGPMSSYVRQHRQYVRWKMNYAGLIAEDFPLTGHPILEESIQQMMGLARTKWPALSDYDREVQLLEEFVFPGNPRLRQTLVQWVSPPVIRFSDGKSWLNPPPRFAEREEFFARSMEDFSALMGAALALVRGKTEHNCPRRTCSLHSAGLCSSVVRHPVDTTECDYLKLFRSEFFTAGKRSPGTTSGRTCPS